MTSIAVGHRLSGGSIRGTEQTEQPASSNDEPLWFVGFDWGSEKHRVSLFDRNGSLTGRRDLGHSAIAYAELGNWLLSTTWAQPSEIAVAIETSHGPAVDALIDRGFRTFAINPKPLDRFRDRYSTAGAKDDTRDADTLGRSLRTDRAAFRELSLDNPLIVQLREVSRLASELTRDRVRLTSRMRAQRWRYYPQILTWMPTPGCSSFGSWHRPRPRAPGCTRRPSPAFSRSITSEGWMPIRPAPL